MKKIMLLIKQRELLAFFILTFTISWTIWILTPFFFYDKSIQKLINLIGTFSPSISAILISRTCYAYKRKEKNSLYWLLLASIFIIIYFIGVFSLKAVFFNISPDLASLFLMGILALLSTFVISRAFSANYGESTLIRSIILFKINIIWYFITILLSPLIYLIAGLLDNILGGTLDIWVYYKEPLIYFKNAIIIYLSILFIGGPVNEEAGWRGFALPRLLDKFSPLLASIILGFIWALWHGPMHFNGFYRYGIREFLLRFLINVPVSIFFTWIWIKTGGSLLMAVFLHTCINTDGLFIPVSSLSGLIFAIIVFIILVVIIITNRMWEQSPVSVKYFISKSNNSV